MQNQSIGTKLARLRKMRQISRMELANEVSVPPAELALIEQGLRPMTPELCRSISAYLNVPEKYLTEEVTDDTLDSIFAAEPLDHHMIDITNTLFECLPELNLLKQNVEPKSDIVTEMTITAIAAYEMKKRKSYVMRRSLPHD